MRFGFVQLAALMLGAVPPREFSTVDDASPRQEPPLRGRRAMVGVGYTGYNPGTRQRKRRQTERRTGIRRRR